MNSFLLVIAAFCLLQLTFASSSSSSSTSSSSTSSSSSVKVPSEVAVAVTASGDLITFKTDKPNKIWSRSSITGLVEGDSIVNIDFRPADGKLYAIGSKSNAYTISSDGVATQVGDTFSPAIQGTA